MVFRNFLRRLTVTALLLAGGLSARAQFTVEITDFINTVLDGASATADFVVTAADIPTKAIITNVTLTIDFAKGDAANPAAPARAGEIGFTLTNGIDTLEVVTRHQWPDEPPFYTGVMKFSDTAPTPAASLPGPTPGEFRASGFFDIFFNLELQPGVWKLNMIDTQKGAPLEIRTATLAITATPVAVPEPATWTLAGAGALLGLVAGRRFFARRS